MDALFFWLFSLGMLVGGLAVILSRNPVTSALCFAVTIFFMAALFVMLSAFFLAAVQILVTAGAVMVLFLFIIMLLDPAALEYRPRRKAWMGCALLVGLGFIYLVARTLNVTPIGAVNVNALAAQPYREVKLVEIPRPAAQEVIQTSPTTTSVSPDGATTYSRSTAAIRPVPPLRAFVVVETDDTHAIGRLLFTTYVAPFEITSLLILVATIGVVVLCKQEEPRRPARREEISHEAPPLEPEKETALTR